jgi:hypothetical protein
VKDIVTIARADSTGEPTRQYAPGGISVPNDKIAKTQRFRFPGKAVHRRRRERSQLSGSSRDSQNGMPEITLAP